MDAKTFCWKDEQGRYVRRYRTRAQLDAAVRHLRMWEPEYDLMVDLQETYGPRADRTYGYEGEGARDTWGSDSGMHPSVATGTSRWHNRPA